MKKQSKKRRVGRPSTGVRPSIAIRVHQELYDELCETAARSKRSISEEAERRLQQVPLWERQFGDAQNLMKQTREALDGERETALRGWGYERLSTERGHFWAEPGVDMSPGPLSFSVDVAAFVKSIEPELVKLFARFLGQTYNDKT